MDTSIQRLEYLIRKYQRGIRVAVKTNMLLAEEPAEAFLKRNSEVIMQYAREVTKLKKLLLSQAGYCSPRLPSGPV